MSAAAPLPAVPLAFQTTGIYSNTLYAFQSNAFQSIALTQGAVWKELPMGVSVNGSQAVVAQSQGQDVLFIVGGRSNSSNPNFPGFQKYIFGTNAWQELTPETSVAQNRVQHGAVYLQTTKSILIFGGSQDNSYSATSQTYTITADEPYTMKSWPAGAPAVKEPILMPYNTSHALLAGGGANQDEIWTFSEANGWVMMTTMVNGGIGDASKVKGAVTTDASGKKTLELFDLSVSPNKVTQVPLSNQFKRDVEINSQNAKRQGSAAPTAVRSGFDLAQAADKIVLTGGTSDTGAGPMAIYNQAANGWTDAQAVFGSSAGSGAGSSSPLGVDRASTGASAAPGNSASAPAASVAPAASSNAANPAASSAAAASGAHPSASVSGSAAAATASGAAATQSGGASASAAAASGSSNASGAAASAATGGPGGAAAASGAAGAAGAAPSGAPTGGASADSTSVILAAVLGSFFGIAAIFIIALLIVRYRRNKLKQMQERDAALEEKRAISPASSVGTINAGNSPYNNNGGKRSPFENGQTPMISKPTLQPRNQAEDLAPPRPLGNDEGWSRYFANNNTVENLYPGTESAGHDGHSAGALAAGAAAGAAAGYGAAHLAPHPGTRDTTYTNTSEYTMDSPTSSHNRESALVVPRLGNGGADAYGHQRSLSNGTIPEDASVYPSASEHPGHDTWDPTRNNAEPMNGRPASSVYYDRASSVYPPHPLSPNTMGNFPPVPIRPTTSGSDTDKGMRSIISKDFGGDQAGNYAFPESAARRVTPGSEPRSAGNATGRKENGGDLSWLKMA